MQASGVAWAHGSTGARRRAVRLRRVAALVPGGGRRAVRGGAWACGGIGAGQRVVLCGAWARGGASIRLLSSDAPGRQAVLCSLASP